MTGARVLTALRIERLAIARGLQGSVPVWHVGMGCARAAATRVPGTAEDGLFVAGVCGALRDDMQPGDLLVATEVRADPSVRGAVPGAPAVIRCPAAPLLAGALRRRGLRVHSGPLVTTRRLAGPERPGPAVAVDMESWPLLANHPDRPVGVVRAVSDTPARPPWSPAILRGGFVALRALRQLAPTVTDWATTLGPRNLRLAAPRSFCAGVERAIEVVEKVLDRQGPPVYVRKQIVHNAHVVADLESRGVVFVDELDEVPAGATVVFSAHGVSPAVRRAATERDLVVVDATCPLVSKVHAEARRFASRGNTVLLIGHAGHEEVEGTAGEAPEQVMLVQDAAEAARLRVADPSKVSYLMQTTLAVGEAQRVVDVLQQRFPSLDGPATDDICYATTNRQEAVRAIARGCDLILVVGSRNSSNSLRLVEVAEEEGSRARLVDDAGDIELSWLRGTRNLGLTAGASAPPALVDEVISVVAGLGPVDVREESVATEAVRFTLPKEVC
jgi:4-hydroxy-3-methylbut-2-enyl diphosphate reductase